jgi:hypothetical protein
MAFEGKANRFAIATFSVIGKRKPELKEKLGQRERPAAAR